MVAANYGVARRNLGTVSLFGPTRMDYRLAIATVREAAQILSEFVEEVYDDGDVDDRFEILEVWRRPLRRRAGAAVRVLAKVEAGAIGPEEYAVGITTRPDAQLVAAARRGRALHRSVVRRGPLGGRRAGQRRRPRRRRREPAVRAARAGRPGLARRRARLGGDRARRPALGAARAVGAGRGAVARAATRSRRTRSTAATRRWSCCARTPTPRPSGSRTAAVDHLAARDARSLTRLLLRRGEPRRGPRHHRGGPGQPRPPPRRRRRRGRRPAIADWCTVDPGSADRRAPVPLHLSAAAAPVGPWTTCQAGPRADRVQPRSVADPIVLMAAARKRRTSMVAKRELFERHPAFGLAARRLARALMLNRIDRRSTARPTSRRPGRDAARWLTAREMDHALEVSGVGAARPRRAGRRRRRRAGWPCGLAARDRLARRSSRRASVRGPRRDPPVEVPAPPDPAPRPRSASAARPAMASSASARACGSSPASAAGRGPAGGVRSGSSMSHSAGSVHADPAGARRRARVAVARGGPDRSRRSTRQQPDGTSRLRRRSARSAARTRRERPTSPRGGSAGQRDEVRLHLEDDLRPPRRLPDRRGRTA